MDRVSWDWILNGLDEALDFCQGLGLRQRFEAGRFGEHRVRVAKLVSALKIGGQNGAKAEFNEHPARSSTALTEGFELAETLPFARSVASETIKPRLVRILRGPAVPTDENANTNEARNVLFELNVASKLWRAGFQPELSEHPDVRCSIDGRAVHIECKRPFSRSGSRQAYTDSLAQIRKGLAEAPRSARGVVALSVTRLLNVGNRVIEHCTKDPLEDRLGELLERATAEVSRGWNEPAPEVIGLLWHVATPALDTSQTPALFGVAEQLNVQAKSPLGSEDGLQFKKLVDGFQRVARAQNQS